MVVFIIGAFGLLWLGSGGSAKFRALLAGGIVLLVLSVVGYLYAGNVQLGGRSKAVSGRVTDRTTGRTIAHAKVTLATRGVPLTTYTNSDGFWVVDNLPVPPGTHLKISAEAPGYETYDGDVPDIAVSQPPPIELIPSHPPISPPQPVDVGGKKTNGGGSRGAGSKSVTVAGKVLGQGGSEVFGAEVLVESGTTQRRESTDSNGTFRVLGVIAGPDMQITVRAKGYKSRVLNLSPEDTKHSINIQLDPEPVR